MSLPTSTTTTGKIAVHISNYLSNLAKRELPTMLIEKAEKTGEPLFTEDDIYKTTDNLSRILRKYCVSQNITVDYFTTLHRKYCESLGYLPHQINHDRNNLKRAIYRPYITKKKFEMFFNVLGVQILNIRFDFKTDKGEHVTCSLYD